ncbi:CPBP family intramembrane metalloprotease [Nitriliruptoraceae bacterium ZYF776]|nr:CPBP family intramembrane metalloprotease [Profundirhabdus halotolerans]
MVRRAVVPSASLPDREADVTAQTVPLLRRGGGRATVAAAVLAVVWGTAFAAEVLPFFPLIVAGGVATGAAGVWVRRGERGWHEGEAERRRFPPFRVTPAHAALAVAVGVVHLGVGHGLFALGELLLPELTRTAASVYDRADSLPLWAAILLGGALTASLEEIFWRGAVQPLTISMARDRFPRLAGIPFGPVLFSTVLYTLFHVATLQLALIAAAALGGLIWGWLLERTGSVGATMIAHATWTSLMLVFPPV